jgi:hypothetical protein
MMAFVLFFYIIMLGLMGIGMMIAMRKTCKEMAFTDEEIKIIREKILEWHYTTHAT